MRRNYCWTKTPARIIAIKKWKTNFGSLHIEAVLQESRKENDEVEPNNVTIDWAYAPAIKLSDKMRGNLVPACYEWAYENAEVGMDVIIHHCLDHNIRYFYYF